MRYQRILGLIVLAFLSTSAILRGSVAVTLTAQPDSILPGVPVTLLLHVTNTGDSPATLRNYVRLAATGPAGQTWFATRPAHDNADKLPFAETDDSSLVLAPGASRDIWIPINHFLDGPPIFNDPRATVPGRLLIQAYVPVDGTETTAVVPLTVKQPVGSDAAVWSLMTTTASGPWTASSWSSYGARLALTVLSQYPASGYAPYFALFGPGPKSIDRVPFFEQGLAVATGPIADELRVCIASAHEAAMEDALYNQGNADKAIAESDAARQAIADVLRSPYAPFRASAVEVAKELKTAAEIRELITYFASTAQPAPLRLLPLVECIEPSVSDPTAFIARFGYVNPNRRAKDIDVGTNNRVTPGMPDHGQPRHFAPGENHDVFGVAAKGRARWDLDGKAVDAVQDSAKRCARPASTQPLRAFIDCVKTAGDNKALVTFGYINANPFPLQEPVGPTNQLSGAEAKDQPTLFLPGVQHKAWTVTAASGASVSWTLDGAVTTVTAVQSTVPCPGAGQ